MNSHNRIDEMKKLTDELKDIHLLDGNIVEYNDIRFGGTASWYDGKYLERFDMTLSRDGVLDLWKRKMTDARAIYGIDSFLEIYNQEIQKLQDIYLDSDIIVTHINPSIDYKHIPKKYTLLSFSLFKTLFFISVNHSICEDL
jgi:hypothetical protein